jgi:chromosome segregation ATPase
VSPSRIGQIEDKAFRRIRWVCNNIDIHDRSALDALIARRRDEAAEAERIRKRDALQKALDQERKRKAKQDRDEVRRAKARDSAWNRKLRVAQAELDRMRSDAQFFAEQIAQIEQRANWLRAILPRDRQLAALREQADEIRDAIASAEASISNMLASPPDGPQLGKEASTNDGH